MSKTMVAQMVKKSACNAGDPGSTPGLRRSPGEENGYPLQYSCLENSMERGAWWATVHGGHKSWTQLSHSHTHTHTFILNGKVFLQGRRMLFAEEGRDVRQTITTDILHKRPPGVTYPA